MRATTLCLLFSVACNPAKQADRIPAPTPAPVVDTTAATPIEADPIEPDPAEPSGPTNSPVSLTASDGSGLTIVSFTAHAVVEDPLAFTELHLVFHNPRAQQIEGQFSITLPPTATLSRFATKQDWGWQEGEVVELQAARRAYEDFLHRRQDPALLEKQPGNEFHARVFPIAASGDKEIILSYSEALTRAGEPYRVHLRGLPMLEHLDVRAVVGRHGKEGAASSMGGTRYAYETVELHKEHLQPTVDFAVPLPAVSQQPQAGLRNQGLVVARITPVTRAAPDPIDAQGGLYVLFDTSASRALGYAATVSRLSAVLQAVAVAGGAALPLKVVAFDQDVADLYEGPIGGFDAAAQQKLLDRGALGASNLAAALAHVAQPGARRYTRLLVVSDGIVTAGATEPPALKRAALALTQVGVQRIDAMVTGGLRDAVRLSTLVTAGLAHDGVVLDGDRAPIAIARRLARATVSHLKVEVPHAAWVWPAQLDGIQPGDNVLIYAQMNGQGPVVVNLDGPAAAGKVTHFSYPVALTEVQRPLIERAVVSAEIQRLEAQRAEAEPARAASLHKEIVALSTKFRVLCDETALLVLETEDDYARFQIDRRALSDILTVGAGGIEVINRRGTAQPVAKLAPPPVRPRPEFPSNKDKKKADGADDRETGGPPEKEESLGGLSQKAAGAGGVTASNAMAPALQHAAAPPPAAPAPASAPGEATRRRVRGGDDLDGLLDSDSAQRRVERIAAPEAEQRPHSQVNPYEGKLKEVMDLLSAKKLDAAERKAAAWRAADAGDVLALIALGEVYERRGNKAHAARAYGSIIDLFPGRADLRRFAGERLERLAAAGLPLAIDTYEKARAQRPDHPASHRLLAFALVRAGDLRTAFDVIREGAAQRYPEDRFRGVDRILREDIGLIGAALIKRDPKRAQQITAQVIAAGATIPTEPSLRFVLNWETDANDVDFHILDGQGGHAYFSQPHLISGGDLYADVTTGYGPECFTIPGKISAYPYTLQAHYYSRGPMGYGMGKLEIIEHDGQGGLKFEERAFVIMVDQAFVDLGRVTGPLGAQR